MPIETFRCTHKMTHINIRSRRILPNGRIAEVPVGLKVRRLQRHAKRLSVALVSIQSLPSAVRARGNTAINITRDIHIHAASAELSPLFRIQTEDAVEIPCSKNLLGAEGQTVPPENRSFPSRCPFVIPHPESVSRSLLFATVRSLATTPGGGGGASVGCNKVSVVLLRRTTDCRPHRVQLVDLWHPAMIYRLLVQRLPLM